MSKRELQVLVAEQKILNRIYVIRGQKIMIDEDLASMYGVETRRLNEQVKRNIKRFPKDFMFTLTPKEYDNLKSQNATSSWGGRRKLPNATTVSQYNLIKKQVIYISLFSICFRS